MAVGDTAVKTTSPDTSQVGVSEDNALGQQTDYKKQKSKQKLRHQLWQRGLLRKRAASSWLHLGHTEHSRQHKAVIQEELGGKGLG